MEKKIKQTAPITEENKKIKPHDKNATKIKVSPLFFVAAIILIGVGSYVLGVKKSQPAQETIPQSSSPSNNETTILNLPSAFRAQGSTADIKTVNLKTSTGKTSSNLLHPIVPKVFAAGELMRPVIYLVPSPDNVAPFADNPDNPGNPARFLFFSYDLLSGEKTQLTQESFAAPIDFTLSTAGIVVFSSNKDLMMINLSDSSIVEIPATGKLGYEGPYPPSISPDGNKIALFRGSTLVVRNLDNTGEVEEYPLPENVLKNQAIWANSGEDIYFETVRSVDGLGANDILDLNRNTKEITTVVTSDTAKHQIAFFDGGKYNSLLYVSEALGSNMDPVLTINNLGTGPVEYPAINGSLKSLVWTPNHDKLYYTQTENINGGSFTGGVREFEFSAEKLGKVSKILDSIVSPYVYLVGFGKSDQELIVSDSALNSDQTLYITSYYSFDIQNKKVKELFSFQTPNNKGSK